MLWLTVVGLRTVLRVARLDASLSFVDLTVESEPGEGAMPRATGRSAQILRARGRMNARSILTKRLTARIGICCLKNVTQLWVTLESVAH